MTNLRSRTHNPNATFAFYSRVGVLTEANLQNDVRTIKLYIKLILMTQIFNYRGKDASIHRPGI